MLSRYASAVALTVIVMLPRAVGAQELSTEETPATSLTATAAAVPGADAQDSRAVAGAPRSRRSWQAPILHSLHVTTIATQMLDAHSTLLAIDRGAVEAHPFMRGLASHGARFTLVKAAGAAGLVFATHTLAKRNKLAATSAGINGLYLFAVSHNYKIARGR